MKPEEMAALGDWQTVRHPECGQHAAALLISQVRCLPACEGPLGGRPRRLAPSPVGRISLKSGSRQPNKRACQWLNKLLRQDRQPVWAASQDFADVQKRLRLSKDYVQQAEKER